MPAQKSLKTDQVAVRQGNDRLIYKRKLITLDSVTQVELEPCTFEKALAHSGTENGNTVVLFACIMHGYIGVPKRFFRRVIIGVARSDTDIYTDRDAVAAKREWLRNAAINAWCDLLRFCRA